MENKKVVTIFVDNREWNISAINDLYGFDEESFEDADDLSNEEIAEELKFQTEHEYFSARNFKFGVNVEDIEVIILPCKSKYNNEEDFSGFTD